MKKKGWIIAFIIVVAIVITIVTLCYTLFTVSSVEIEYRTSIVKLDGKDEEIKKSANLRMGSCIFFQSKKEYIKNIEKAFPYANVIDIETVFPSTLKLHIAEREPYFYIQNNDQEYILDKSLKVLQIKDETYEHKLIQLNGLTLLNTSLTPGDVVKPVENSIVLFYDAFYRNNMSTGMQISFIQSLQLGTKFEPTTGHQEQFISLKNNSGYEIIFNNAARKLPEKVQKALAVLSVLPGNYHNTTYLELSDLYDGGIYYRIIDKTSGEVVKPTNNF